MMLLIRRGKRREDSSLDGKRETQGQRRVRGRNTDERFSGQGSIGTRAKDGRMEG